MKKIYSFISILLFVYVLGTAVGAYAQSGDMSDGYYRIKNADTDRYIHFLDDKGSYMYQTQTFDLGAIVLKKGIERAISDPASVLYLENQDPQYDIKAQNIGLYSLIEMYVNLMESLTPGAFWAYCKKGSMTMYLWDAKSNMDAEESYLDTKGSSREWYVNPIDSSTENYFGVAPTHHAGGKHYASMYAAFPFSFASPGMKAYYITTVDAAKGVAVYKEITGTIPALTPVIIECSSENPADNKLNIGGSGSVISDNLGKGVLFELHKYRHDNFVTYDKNTMRTIGIATDGSLAMTAAEYQDVPKNTFYISVSADCPQSLQLVSESEYQQSGRHFRPVAPEAATVSSTGNDGEVLISWTPVTIDEGGNPLGDGQVTYTILDHNGVMIAEGLTETSFVYQAVPPGERDRIGFYVYSVTEAGISESFAFTSWIIVGTSYSMPYIESFDDGKRTTMLMKSAEDDKWIVCDDTYLSDITDADGTNGYIVYEGRGAGDQSAIITYRIDLDVPAPVLTFAYYGISEDDDNVIDIWLWSYESEKEVLLESVPQKGNGCWIYKTISLAEYSGHTVQIQFLVTEGNNTNTFIDDIRIQQSEPGSSAVPVAPEEATISRTAKDGEVTISWTPVTVDVYDNPLDASQVTYTIVDENLDVIAEGLTGTSHTFQAVPDGEQDFIYYYVFAVTDAGMSTDYAVTNMIAAGTPYGLPYAESFNDAITSHHFGIYGDGAGKWQKCTDTSFSDIVDADGTNGYLIYERKGAGDISSIVSGMIELSSSTPVLSFAYYGISEYDDNVIDIRVRPLDGEWTQLESIPQRGDARWIYRNISLAEYSSLTVQIQFVVIGKNYKNTFIDDIRIQNSESRIPAAPAEATAARTVHDGEVIISWTPVTTDIFGQPLNSGVTYKLVDDKSKVIAEGLTGTSYTHWPVQAGAQDFVRYHVFAVTGEVAGDDYASTETIAVGTPYELPYAESFDDGEMTHPMAMVGGYGKWFLGTDSTYNNMDDADGTNGFIYYYSMAEDEPSTLMSGLINIPAYSPVLSFAYNAIAEDDYNTIDVYLAPSDGSEPVLLESFTQNGDGSWMYKTVDLSEYSGRTAQIYFVAKKQRYYNTILDDIRIYQTVPIPVVPVAPADATVFRTDNEGEVRIYWTPVTVDEEGNPLDADEVTYTIVGMDGMIADGLTNTNHTFQAVETGKQKFVQYWVFAVTGGVMSKFAAITELIAVGTPYKLPYIESFDDYTYSDYPFVIDGGKGFWCQDKETSIIESLDSDSTNGIIYYDGEEIVEDASTFMTGLIGLNAENPVLTFSYYCFADDDYNTIDVYVSSVDSHYPILLETVIQNGIGWRQKEVSLARYSGQTVQISFKVTRKNYKYIVMDDIIIRNKEKACNGVEFSYDGRYLTIKTPTEGAGIHYSVDGSDPKNGMICQSDSLTFDVMGLCQVRAVAVKDGYSDSEIAVYAVQGYADERHAVTSAGGLLESCYRWNRNEIPTDTLIVEGVLNVDDYDYIRSVEKLRHVDIEKVADADIPDRAFAGTRIVSISMPATISRRGTGILAETKYLCAVIWNSADPLGTWLTADISNPNVLLYVRSGVKVYDSRSLNVVEDGTASSVTLHHGYPFNAPLDFKAHYVSLTRNFHLITEVGKCAGWETIVLPFVPDVITHETAGLITPFAKWDGDPNGMKPFWLKKSTSYGWENAGAIEACVPYIISMPNSKDYVDSFILAGKVTFSANNVDLGPAASRPLATAWREGTMLEGMFMPVEESNLLAMNVHSTDGGDLLGSKFVEYDTAVPFEAYVRNAGARRAMPVFGDQSGTGIPVKVNGGIAVDSPSPGTIRIHTESGRRVNVFTANGLVVASLDMDADETATVDDLLSGFYICGGIKVFVK